MPKPIATAPTGALRRLARCLYRQSSRNLVCPPGPDLTGRRALVTGGNNGIGREIVAGLVQRGAAVTIACRELSKGHRVAEALAGQGPRVDVVGLDLADLAGVDSTVDAAATIDSAPVDLLVENAGVWPRRYATTAQGHEVAFGTNVLGHFALRRRLMDRRLLADDARVVVLTGDIYVLAGDCTPDYRWRGELGGLRAYCRSKLGNLWIAGELGRRHPKLSVYVAHPGVVATDLGGAVGGLSARLKKAVMLPPAAGAQTPLLCATQPDLPAGAYYHNVAGRMRLAPEDPARNQVGARTLWETCEALIADHTAALEALPG